jgi:hypothetical protein
MYNIILITVKKQTNKINTTNYAKFYYIQISGNKIYYFIHIKNFVLKYNCK